MKNLGIFLRLSFVWLLASLLAAIWIQLTDAIVPASLWADRLFSIILIVIVTPQVSPAASFLLKRLLVLGREGLSIIATLLIGAAWFFLVSLVASPSLQISVYLAVGITTIMVALGIQILWQVERHELMPYIGALQEKLPNLHLRIGRLRASFRRTGVVTGLLSCFLIAWAAFANFRVSTAEWQPVASGHTVPPSVQSMLFDVKSGYLFAGTTGGIYRSNNGGENWQQANSGLGTMRVWELAQDSQVGTLYAATAGGVYRSNDAGVSWNLLNSEIGGVVTLALDMQRGILYAGSVVSDRVYRSRDLGESWELINDDIGIGQLQTLSFDEQNGVLYAGTSRGLYQLGEEGTNWFLVSDVLGNVSVQALVIDKNQEVYYVGTRNSVYRSDDSGVNWIEISGALSETAILRDLAIDQQNGVIYAGTWNGVFSSKDNGDSWQLLTKGLGDISVGVLAVDQSQGSLYAGTNSSGIYLTRNEGKNWQPVSQGLDYTHILSLAWDEEQGVIYAGTNGGGVYRSDNNGNSWQPFGIGLSSTHVPSLIIGPNQRIFAGTNGGVYRTDADGDSWQFANDGLNGVRVWSFTQDDQEEILFAGTGNGVYRTIDGGDSWLPANTGLEDTFVSALALDYEQDVLYAGTNNGIYRSRDNGDSWEHASSNLSNLRVRSLSIDGNRGTIYAGTNDGNLYFSEDSGNSWRLSSIELNNTPIQTIALDEQQSTLFIGTGGYGIYKSTNQGLSWRPASRDLNNNLITALVWDSQQKILYAGTTGGFNRSDDGGESWQLASRGLTHTDLLTFIQSEQRGAVYAGAWQGGVFRSSDRGISWQPVNNGLSNIGVRSLAEDSQRGILYAGIDGGNVYRSNDGGESWHAVSQEGYLLSLLSLQPLEYHATKRGVNEALSWKIEAQSEAAWVFVLRHMLLRHDVVERVIVGNDTSTNTPVSISVWGGTIGVAELGTDLAHAPLVWIVLRDSVWTITNLLPTITWIVILATGLMVIFLLTLASNYANLSRPFGVPLWATFLARRQIEAYVRSSAFETFWPLWERLIRSELIKYGDVKLDDLSIVPPLLRRYALTHYVQLHDETEAIESDIGHVQLIARERANRWERSRESIGRELDVRQDLNEDIQHDIQVLANSLAESLGLTLEKPRVFGNVLAYQTEAPALRLRLPPHFPLIFVANPRPDKDTVRTLVDAVDVMHETGFFALVIPLESSARELDSTTELRRIIDQSQYIHDLILLTHDDVLKILIARQPIEMLVQFILRQVNLVAVSPFVLYGPVSEKMFFGRESELKTLVETVDNNDFAIVGNRKIGKTSLLKRALSRLEADGNVYPLYVDCQAVRNAEDFYTTFMAQTGLVLSTATPESFRICIMALREEKQRPLVILMDEVDSLLTSEMSLDEPLAATWRSLAQGQYCHFIFCGSTGLIRRLDDPKSVFFNFPQPMPLGYLSAEVAHSVLTVPLEETLGIQLVESTKILDEVMALTSGHPNFIQYVGHELVVSANKRQERRVFLDDVEALWRTSEFANEYLKVVWGDAGPLEKIITLIAPPDGFRLAELEERLLDYEIPVLEEEVDNALHLLQTFSILKKEGQKYMFIPRALARFLYQTQNVDRLIKQAKRALEEELS